MNRRNYAYFSASDAPVFKQKVFMWLKNSSYAVFLDSHQFPLTAKTNNHYCYDWIAAKGAVKIVAPDQQPFKYLQMAFDENKDWWFGILTYDLKNETENLYSRKPDNLQFPSCLFFLPEILVFSKNGKISIGIYENPVQTNSTPDEIFNLINNSLIDESGYLPEIKFVSRTSKSSYLENINHLMNHILKGDIYEINYCMEFFADQVQIDPWLAYSYMEKVVPAPFSCFFCLQNNYLLSASPERYLMRKGQTLISQPMKGTAPRGLTPVTDEIEKQQLLHSEKEKAENVMIVDLVRNDFSRIAERNSVIVEELFGLYSFSKVHQMVSTVKCLLKPGTNFSTIIKSTFPMGSMTGAPKIRAMELIEQYEEIKRSVFSGTAGYIDPEGNFDFNVLIRSFIYNKETKYLSIESGSAITASSDPIKEYEECLLKAGYMIAALGGTIAGSLK